MHCFSAFEKKESMKKALVLKHCIIMFNMRALLNLNHLRACIVWTTWLTETGLWLKSLWWTVIFLNKSVMRSGLWPLAAFELLPFCLIIVERHSVLICTRPILFTRYLYQSAKSAMLRITLKHCGTLIVVWEIPFLSSTDITEDQNIILLIIIFINQ